MTGGTVGAVGAAGAVAGPVGAARAEAPRAPAGPGGGPDAPGWPVTVPSLAVWAPGDGHWRPGPRCRIVVSGPEAPAARQVAALLAADLRALLGREVPVTGGAPRAGDIALSLDADDDGLGPEGYLLDVGAVCAVRALARTGLLYGTRSVLQAIVADPARRAVPGGRGRDVPAFAVRGEMIDCGRKFYPLDYLRAEVRRLAWYKLNTLHLHLTDWNGFRFESLAFPGLASPAHYTQAELRALDAHAADWGVTIVPELDVPAHACWLTRYDPRLRLTDPSMDAPGRWTGSSTGGWTLDVTSGYAREVVRTLLRELARVFSGPYLHIGGDEIPDDAAKERSPTLVRHAAARGWPYPGDVFVDFANDLNATVRSLGRTAELWQWWDYDGQRTSLVPDRSLRVDEWLEADPGRRARMGYPTIGTYQGSLYVSPGLGVAPGQYGHMPAETVYQEADFPGGPNIEGYKVCRWSDRAENQPAEWHDFFAFRARQVLAERLWGGPRSADAPRFYARADRVGEPPPSALTTVPWTACAVVSVSSEETDAEDGRAAHAIDGDPRTAWVSRYSPLAEFGEHSLEIDLGGDVPVAGVRLMPRQDGRTVGPLYATPCRTREYRIEVSGDGGRTWRAQARGLLPDEQPARVVLFRAPVTARRLRFVAVSDWAAVGVVSLAELAVLRRRGG